MLDLIESLGVEFYKNIRIKIKFMIFIYYFVSFANKLYTHLYTNYLVIVISLNTI